MARVTIEFTTDNAAFDERPEEEVSAILNRLQASILRNGLTPHLSYPLRDSNGNRVGWCKIDPE